MVTLRKVFPSPTPLFPTSQWGEPQHPSPCQPFGTIGSRLRERPPGHPPALHRGQVPRALTTCCLLQPSHFLQLWQISCLCNKSPAGGQHVSIHVRSPLAPAPPCPTQPQCARQPCGALAPQHRGPGEGAAPWYHTVPLCPHQHSGALLLLGFLSSGGGNQ